MSHFWENLFEKNATFCCGLHFIVLRLESVALSNVMFSFLLFFQSNQPQKLYHYTDANGANGILESGRIRGSRSEVADASYGNGVYLTSKPPHHGKDTILANNYGNEAKCEQGKADYYVAIDRQHLAGAKNISGQAGRDVWVHHRDIPLNRIPHEVAETPNAPNRQNYRHYWFAQCGLLNPQSPELLVLLGFQV